MNKLIIITSLCLAVIAASVSAILVTGNRAAQARAQADRAESRAEEARALERKAQAEEQAEATKNEANRRALEAVEKDRERKRLERDTSENEAARASEERKKAEAEAAAARAKAEEASSLAAAEKAKAAAARAEADKAKAEAAKAEAQNQAAQAQLEKTRLETELRLAEAKAWEIRQSDLLALEQELAAYKLELDERERALHPEKTIRDLVTTGEADSPKPDEAAAKLPENNPDLSLESRALAKATRLLAESDARRAERAKRETVAIVERLYTAAVRDGRVTDAAYYRKLLKGLYPDWEYRPDATPEEEEKGKESK